jgi:hypothetical protein
MKTKQDDDTEDDRGKDNLSDAVVENLLVGVRGVTEVGFLLSRHFNGDDGTGGCVLFYVHVLDSLFFAAQRFPCGSGNVYSWGVPPFPGGKGVYNKGSPSLQQLFSKLLQIDFQNGTA